MARLFHLCCRPDINPRIGMNLHDTSPFLYVPNKRVKLYITYTFDIHIIKMYWNHNAPIQSCTMCGIPRQNKLEPAICVCFCQTAVPITCHKTNVRCHGWPITWVINDINLLTARRLPYVKRCNDVIPPIIGSDTVPRADSRVTKRRNAEPLASFDDIY